MTSAPLPPISSSTTPAGSSPRVDAPTLLTAVPEPSPDTSERPWAGSAFMPQVQPLAVRDLAYASALLAAAEDLHRQPDLRTLLTAVVVEASIIIKADGAVIVEQTGLRRLVRQVHLDPHSEDHDQEVRQVAAQGWLGRAGYRADLTLDARWMAGPARVAAPTWRSLITVALVSPDPRDQLRLSWFSSTPDAFAGQTQVVELVGRHADLAIRALARRPAASEAPT